jgi:DNA-binding NarL/FixJ family response regulator
VGGGPAAARALPLGAFLTTLGVVGQDPARLVHQASAALLAGAGRSGVVVGVDDAHLLDELSATLVHQLVLRRAATVVLTLRTGQPAPDAVTGLWKDGHLTRLELQPLSQDEITNLVEAALDGPVESVAARRLWTLTRGNALYLRQLVDGERESGRLHQVAGVWRWSGEPELSPGLVELVSARIGQLPDEQRAVLEVLAFTEPLSVPVLAQLTDAAAVEHVEARGLVEVYPDERELQVRLAHPLYGEVQRGRMGTLHSRRLRGRIVRAMPTRNGRQAANTLRRALLALDSDLEQDPVLLTAAAHQAAEAGDFELTMRVARAAVDAGGGFEPQLLLGEVLTWCGRAAEADTELAPLEALASTDIERVKAGCAQASVLAFNLGRFSDALKLLDTLASHISDDVAMLELAARRALFDAILARTVQAADSAAVVLADPRSSPAAVELASWGLAISSGGLGRLGEMDGALRWVDACIKRCEITMHQAAIIVAMWMRGMVLAGLLDQAEHTARRYQERFQDTRGNLMNLFWLGELAKSRGQVETTARWCRQVIAGSQGADPAGYSFIGLVGLTEALGMAGDAAAARQTLAEILTIHNPELVGIGEPAMLLAGAWVAAAEGSVSEARIQARHAAEVAASQQQLALEVVTLHTAVCFGDRTVAARLAEPATQVDGPRAPAAAAHAAALAADDGAALHAASIQLETMGALLLAADAAAQAADAHTRHGRRGSAQAAATRAQRLAQACEGARTPALAAPPTLTGREREIVTLAAGGLSNREIAERLVVSTRTVEGHLYRACAKLGASDRTQLASLLHGG